METHEFVLFITWMGCQTSGFCLRCSKRIHRRMGHDLILTSSQNKEITLHGVL
jgi:hypothetical protein